MKKEILKEQVDIISDKLNVKPEEVISMNRRMMSQEKSLNDPIKSDEKSEWQDWIVDQGLDQELHISQKQELDEKKTLLHESIKILNDRERKIIEERKLSENPKTLDELSKKYKISRERIRQIETRALKNFKKQCLIPQDQKNLLPAK